MALTPKMAEIKNQDMEEEIATALIQLCCETMIKVRSGGLRRGLVILRGLKDNIRSSPALVSTQAVGGEMLPRRRVSALNTCCPQRLYVIVLVRRSHLHDGYRIRLRAGWRRSSSERWTSATARHGTYLSARTSART